MNVPQQFLKTNLSQVFRKEREQMVAVIKHEQEFADQIADHARMADMEADPNGPVLRTIGPKSDLAPWLEMFPSSALNGSNVYTIAEHDMLATAVDRFKLSMTTLRGALTTQEQIRVIPCSNYVVRRYPNHFNTLAQRRANQQKANLQLGRQLWLAQQNRTNSRTTQELTALYQQSAATLREMTQEMITSFFTAWYERNLQNLRGLRPQTPQMESTVSWLREQIQTFGPLSHSKQAVGLGTAIFTGINHFKIKKLEKNMEIVAKSVAKVSNEVVLVREDMVAVVGTMLRGFWRVRQALLRYNRFLEGTVQTLQFTIRRVSGLSHSVYQLWVRNYYSHIIELWVCPHLQKWRWLMDLLVEQARTLRCGAETLAQERLLPELVPKAALDTAIQKLSIKVRDSYPDYILVTETISDYYQFEGVQSKVQDGRLYIQIPMLLKTREEPMLNLFRLQTFWVPVQNQTHLYTKVSTAADFYATAGITHVDLTKDNLQPCQKIGHFQFCPNPMIQYDAMMPSCTGSLFQNLKRADVLKQCDFVLKEREEVSPGILETKSQLLI